MLPSLARALFDPSFINAAASEGGAGHRPRLPVLPVLLRGTNSCSGALGPGGTHLSHLVSPAPPNNTAREAVAPQFGSRN